MVVWGMLILVYGMMLELNEISAYIVFVMVICILTSFVVCFVMDFIKKLENIITDNTSQPNQESNIGIRQFTISGFPASSYQDESVPNERSEHSATFNHQSPIDNGVSSFYDNS